MTDQTNTEKPQLDHWCIVELMGHQTVAGKVTEENHFGTVLMRVDIPGDDGQPDFTKFYGGSAICAITPVEEQVARAMAKAYDVRPVNEWQLRRMLPEPKIDRLETMDEWDFEDSDEPDYDGEDFTNPDAPDPEDFAPNDDEDTTEVQS